MAEQVQSTYNTEPIGRHAPSVPCFWSSARTAWHRLHSGIDSLLQALRRHRARLRIHGPDDAAVAHPHLRAGKRGPTTLCVQVPMLTGRFSRYICWRLLIIAARLYGRAPEPAAFKDSLHEGTPTLLAILPTTAASYHECVK